MEDVLFERLDFMSTKVREGVTSCREILGKLEEGSPSTKKDEARANRLQSHYDNFVSEIQMFLQNPPSDTNLSDLRPKLNEFTSLQFEASDVLSDLEIYLSYHKEKAVTPIPSDQSTSRLPKLQISRFDGNVLNWYAFWDKFTSSVASKNLSDVDKFLYLEQALEGEAARAIAGLDSTNANYAIAVERLKQRFAKPGILKDSHYVALKEIPRASSDVSDSRKVLDEVERHLQVLKSLGEDTNHTGLRSTILDKFPSDVLENVRRYAKSDDEPVDMIRGYLNEVITSREEFSRRETIKTMGQASTSGFTTEAFFVKPQNQCQHCQPNANKPHNQPNASKSQNQQKNNTNNNQHPKMNRYRNRSDRQRYPTYDHHSNGQKHAATESQPQLSVSLHTGGAPAKRPRKSCLFCSKPHFNEMCETYPTIEARKVLLKNRCFQCFSDSHLSKACTRKMKCRNCGVFGVHNRALCPLIANKVVKAHQSTTVNFSQFHDGAILQTAKAPIATDANTHVTGRILFDTGSERSYISQTLVKKLKLTPTERISLTVYTFGCKTPRTIDTNLVCFRIQTNHDQIEISAYTVPTTTNSIPAHRNLKHRLQEHFPGLPIADDVQEAAPADIIVGNDFYYRFIGSDRKEISPNLFLIESCLGWIPSGALTKHQKCRNQDLQLSFLTYINGDHGIHKATPTPPDPPFQRDVIRSLWEVEVIGITDSPKVIQDDEIVNYFNRTTLFESGRYYVKWPWIQYPPDLPINFGLSHGRLKSLLTRLDDTTLQRYDAVFQDQLEKGVIEIIHETRLPNTHPVHYLPHHCVIQEHKSTKLRVVYDASAKAQGQCSLNDYLYNGPLMLEELTSLLLKFRTYRVAVTADIEKAFLQVGLQADDRDVTRFLWLKDLTRPPTADNLLHLRFCRVPFGVVSSPYLLAATVRLHFQRQSSPLSEPLATCLYVDNLITGATSEKEAFHLYQEARCRFEELSMNIREWCSNEPGILNHIPPEQQSNKTPTMVLGMRWNQQSDQVMLSVKEGLFTEPVTTKRHVSHIVASMWLGDSVDAEIQIIPSTPMGG